MRMPNLFARAASCCSATTGSTGDRDARPLLRGARLCGRDVRATVIRSETRHRAHLLKAASRFTRVFELAAPDAPGLVSFGAQFDPASPIPCMRAVPWSAFPASASRCRKHFRAVSARASSIFPSCRPAMTLLEAGIRAIPPPRSVRRRASSLRRSRRTGCTRMQSFHGTARHGSPTVARSCCRRICACAGRRRQQEVKPPFPLSTGSAAGPSRDAAALHGLLELIERDAASLWWRGGSRGRSIPPRGRGPDRGRSAAAAAAAGRFGAAELVARHHDGYRRALRRGGLLPGGWLWLCLRPGRAADARGRGPRRRFWKCASSNWPMPSSKPSAASAAMPRSTPGIASTCGARRC